MSNHKSGGFTLVELSIVLVIIGLVVGALLMGKDLVRAAELRSVMSQRQNYVTAINTFKAKYGQLPGDMLTTNASQLGFFTFTGSNAGAGKTVGNNNGAIFAGSVETYCAYECGALWRHLSDAGLIGSTGSTLEADTSGDSGVPIGEYLSNNKQAVYMPKAKIGNAYWGAGNLTNTSFTNVTKLNTNRNILFLAQTNGPNYGYTFDFSMSPIDLYALDIKADDGKPNSGSILASTYDSASAGMYSSWGNGVVHDTNGSSGTSGSGDENSLVCTTGGSGQYDVATAYNRNPTSGRNISCFPVFVW